MVKLYAAFVYSMWHLFCIHDLVHKTYIQSGSSVFYPLPSLVLWKFNLQKWLKCRLLYSQLNCYLILQIHMKLSTVTGGFMGLVLLLFCHEKPKGSIHLLTSKLIVPFGFARQYTSERGRPLIKARVFINSRRKCAASDDNRMVVFKWAVI